MDNNWIEINVEKKRDMAFKSFDNFLSLTNVTHFKREGTGCMLKCDQGIVYFNKDDVSYIVSECEDWVEETLHE